MVRQVPFSEILRFLLLVGAALGAGVLIATVVARGGAAAERRPRPLAGGRCRVRPSASKSRPTPRAAAAVFYGALAIYMINGQRHLQVDTQPAIFGAMSFVRQGWFDLTPFEENVAPLRDAVLIRGTDGLTYTRYPPGSTLACIPFASPDLIVGAPLQEVDGIFARGQAYVFSGADGSLLLTPDSPVVGVLPSHLGAAVAGAGDVSGDGLPDIFVGSFLWDSEGRAFVFSGADGSLLHVLNDPTPRLASGFSRSIAVVGDVGTDGILDLLVGDIEDGFTDPDVGLSEAFLFVSSSEVTIQIMTESINPKRHGVIPVAVLTTPDFDSTGVTVEHSVRARGSDRGPWHGAPRGRGRGRRYGPGVAL